MKYTSRGCLSVISTSLSKKLLMGLKLATIFVFLLFSGTFCIARAPVYSYRIINRFPHDTAAFTQGLIFLDGFFFESTGLYGRSSVRKVDYRTGRVLRIKNLTSKYFGEGLVSYGDNLVQLTWREGTGFVYSKDDFSLINEFSINTEGWGLTSDGKNFIMSDGSHNLYFLDKKNFRKIKTVEVHDGNRVVPMLNELEYINGVIYSNIFMTDSIAAICPVSGRVQYYINLSGILSKFQVSNQVDVLNGIAYDKERGRLFVTGKLWPYVFHIEVMK